MSSDRSGGVTVWCEPTEAVENTCPVCGHTLGDHRVYKEPPDRDDGVNSTKWELLCRETQKERSERRARRRRRQ